MSTEPQQMVPGVPWPVAPGEPTTATAPWWDATREQRLVVQACHECDHRQHHPRALCTACGGSDLAVVEASGRGRIVSHTLVHRAPDPRMAAPYLLALVDLDEGPRLLTRLWHPEAPLTAMAGFRGPDVPAFDLCDVPADVAWVPVEGDDLHLPVFVPQVTVIRQTAVMGDSGRLSAEPSPDPTTD